jgi:uncharacterized protein (TIGR00661 family)
MIPNTYKSIPLPSMQKKLHILAAPLDWGLGHATRMIPLLRYLGEQKHHLMIGVNTLTSAFLKAQLPHAEFYDIPSYNIEYSASAFSLSLAKLIPKMIKAKKAENNWVKEFVENVRVDLIISDSRFGFYHSSIPSVIITHQLTLQFPMGYSLLGKIAQAVNEKWLKQFDQIWVPDSKDHYLSGNLSINKKLNAHFIGHQSRLKPQNTPNPIGKEYILCILSGPEPQRTKLEELIMKQSSSIKEQVIIIGGKPQEDKVQYDLENTIYFNHLQDDEMAAFIQNASFIISRSGYSSIMDYYALGCNRLFFIPTPGQTEQIYLAKRLKEKEICDFEYQDAFDLAKFSESKNKLSGFDMKPSSITEFEDLILSI